MDIDTGFIGSSIDNFEDFVAALNIVGMTLGGDNDEGVFSLCNYFSDEIRWHTDQPNTDPWIWRMRVLSECDNIAYAKLFFKKSGYITKEWYSYFYAVRRGHTCFEEEYYDGKINNYTKTIYDLVCEHGSLPLHELKRMGGFSKEDNSKFDRSLTELQMKMYLTMCGQERKQTKLGEEYGWASTCITTTEQVFEKEVFQKADKLSFEESYGKLEEHIVCLNPNASSKKIKKFILG